VYHDGAILLLAFVQIAWRMPYHSVLEYADKHPALAALMGFPCNDQGQVRIISQGQYCERRWGLGLAALLLFMIGLVWQLNRLSVITGRQLDIDTTILAAWRHADSGVEWVHYRGRQPVFGYKVHTVLCRDAMLPVIGVVTPATIPDAQVAIPMSLAAVLLSVSVKPFYTQYDTLRITRNLLDMIHGLVVYFGRCRKSTQRESESVPMKQTGSVCKGFFYYFYRLRAHRLALSDPG
jgi:hypothetical protein